MAPTWRGRFVAVATHNIIILAGSTIRNRSIHRFYMYDNAWMVQLRHIRLLVCDLVRWSKWSVWIPSSAVSTFNGLFQEIQPPKDFFSLFQHLTFTVWLFCILKLFSLWRRQRYHHRRLRILVCFFVLFFTKINFAIHFINWCSSKSINILGQYYDVNEQFCLLDWMFNSFFKQHKINRDW